MRLSTRRATVGRSNCPSKMVFLGTAYLDGFTLSAATSVAGNFGGLGHRCRSPRLGVRWLTHGSAGSRQTMCHPRYFKTTNW